ncbi:MAG: hypothetical protein KDB53_18075, partial [Planctomycetes bacterium]|nr:hypothetical protein [Planctomycetota bacterium]
MNRRRWFFVFSVLSCASLSLVDSTRARGDFPVREACLLEEEFPAKLSETGFYASIGEKRFVDSMVPYEVSSSFWNDGAQKQRHFRLPAGKTIGFRATEPWEFPDGTLFVLTLFLEEGDARLYVETRVIRLHGDHLHFATYTWNAEQDEATLTPEGDLVYANYGKSSQVWQIADVADCFECHNTASQLMLGVKTSQMNRLVAGEDGPVNQLRRLADKGWLTGLPEDLVGLPSQPNPLDAQAPLDARARSYLDTNCASCHRPGGQGSGTLDLRLETPIHLSGLIRLNDKFEPTRGSLVPGHPRRSKLVR